MSGSRCREGLCRRADATIFCATVATVFMADENRPLHSDSMFRDFECNRGFIANCLRSWSHEFVISITATLSSTTQHRRYREEVVVACYSCRSENVKAFTSEIDIRFPGRANLTKSVVASPKLLVCMDCGLADVLLSQDELRNLKEMYSSGSQEILADMECESSTKIPDSGVNE